MCKACDRLGRIHYFLKLCVLTSKSLFMECSVAGNMIEISASSGCSFKEYRIQPRVIWESALGRKWICAMRKTSHITKLECGVDDAVLAEVASSFQVHCLNLPTLQPLQTKPIQSHKLSKAWVEFTWFGSVAYITICHHFYSREYY